MDLLFKRYANPFLLLDEMIPSGMMLDFVNQVVELHNKESEDEALWQFYLHKIFDKTYDEFLREIHKTKDIQADEGIDFETTIKTSMNMLQGFNPAE